MTQQSQKIITNVKFKKDENCQFYGFVTKNEFGSWRGCREESDVKKKIVFADTAACGGLMPNVLYRAILTPMGNGKNGFIAKQMEIVKFKAKIETELHNKTFKVVVRFGNKILTYNPASSWERNRNIQGIARHLKGRIDLEDSLRISEEFLDCACLVLGLYKRKCKK